MRSLEMEKPLLQLPFLSRTIKNVNSRTLDSKHVSLSRTTRACRIKPNLPPFKPPKREIRKWWKNLSHFSNQNPRSRTRIATMRTPFQCPWFCFDPLTFVHLWSDMLSLHFYLWIISIHHDYRICVGLPLHQVMLAQ